MFVNKEAILIRFVKLQNDLSFRESRNVLSIISNRYHICGKLRIKYTCVPYNLIYFRLLQESSSSYKDVVSRYEKSSQ